MTTKQDQLVRRPAKIIRGAVPRRSRQEIERARARRDPVERLNAVQASARGWREAQLAILGLLGIVGVVKGDQLLTVLPDPVRYSMLVLVLIAFLGALAGAVFFTRAAWPLLKEEPMLNPDDEDRRLAGGVTKAQQRVRAGYVMTIVAALAMAAAFTLTWWPVTETLDKSLVQVRTSTGVVCGSLAPSTRDILTVTISDQHVTIPADRILTIESVRSCS